MIQQPRSADSAARGAVPPRAAEAHVGRGSEGDSPAAPVNWWNGHPRVHVCAAGESAALDRAAIEQLGIPSRALMQRAGAAFAAHVLQLAANRLAGGVVVYCGAGNNGGDGWVIARALAAAGVRVRVDEVVAARSADCVAERTLAAPFVTLSQVYDGEQVAVDAVLGTGAVGELRGEVALGIGRLAHAASRGALVFAADTPSGLDATTGSDNGAVPAQHTVTFGTVKRGLLHARDTAGKVTLVDIGLPDPEENFPRLVDVRLVRLVAPPLHARAHKGTRRKIAIVGGAPGMAGAVVLATRAAVASGVGMVRTVVSGEAVCALQQEVPSAMCVSWPLGEAELNESVTSWADALVIGPGLGQSDDARSLLFGLLRDNSIPVVMDADALNLFAGDVGTLRSLLAGRPAVLTPHVGEFARLAGVSASDAIEDPYAAARGLASRTGAVVLLKGVPTVVASPDARCLVSATGTPVLATAGSGDMLAGIVGTLLAQNPNTPLEAAAAAAWAHGRAAEYAGGGGTRGVPLELVISALPGVWQAPLPAARTVLAELPEPLDAGMPDEEAADDPDAGATEDGPPSGATADGPPSGATEVANDV